MQNNTSVLFICLACLFLFTSCNSGDSPAPAYDKVRELAKSELIRRGILF